VRIRDNGAGLPSDHRQGFGMIGMRERVLALGGAMTVASTSQGVTVEALVPNGMKPLQAVDSLL
jgi:two-component system, NarL family, sensor histidine kinase UhpB